MTFWVNVLFVFLVTLPYMINGVLAMYLVDSVLKYEVKHKKIIYLVLALSSTVYGIMAAITSVAEGEANIIIDILDILLIYGSAIIVLAININAKWWKKILIAFLAIDILTSVNHIFDILSDQIIFNRTWNTRLLAMIIIILFRFLFQFLEFVFLYFLKRLRSRNDNTPLPVSVTLTIAVLLNIVVNVVPDLINDANEDNARRVITITGMLAVLIFMALFFYIRVTRKERDDLKDLNHVNEELVASQAKFFENTARSDNEIRAMRHDMRNNIQVLKLLLESGDYDKMREYLDEMGDNLKSADVSAHTGDTIADAIIADKSAEAASRSLKLKCSGTISGVEISPVDMCKILANLLDNAIEAASVDELKELEDDLRAIDLQFRKTDNFFMISVTNPCFKAPVIENGKIVTSKADAKNHGFGIHNIETAASGYGGELTVSCEEKPYGFMFRAEVVFPTSSIE